MSLEEQSQRVFGTVRAAFRSEKTLDIRFRKQQLLALDRFLRDESQMLLDALRADLHKCTFEGDAAEIFLVQAEIAYHLDNIDSWVAPKAAGDKGVAFAFDTCLVHPQPLGVALIIGTWNFPIHLVLMPLVGAISAGCCAILKPSEVSSRSAAALQALDNYLDSECYRVVNGAADVATALLQQPFDHIFYTGGGEVGKIVMEAAAKHLTPVTLEMGGKSPCVVDGNSDLDVVARRILYGKFSNAGQICVSPDYVLCEKPVQSLLVDALQKAYKQFFKTDPKQSSDYCRIINRRHFEKLIDPAKVKIGGEVDESELYIALTVMTDVGPDDPAMKEEIFGPVLPIVTVRDKEEAIEIINSREKPLVIYVFSSDKSFIDKVQRKTTSGTLLVNDTLSFILVPNLPFGGVGNSGTGRYHGYATFTTFSNMRTVMKRSFALEFLNKARYPPYTSQNLAWMKWAIQLKRTGILRRFSFLVIFLAIATIAILRFFGRLS